VKIIHAEGEYQAAEKLVSAASAIATEPVAIQLRYLQTLTEIGMKQNTTVVLPIPLQMIEGLSGLLNKQKVELPVSRPAEPVTVLLNETHQLQR
jgi:regulator of protease activity HflC (stomatin/prohibitin superfamily)